jgi:biopolymer transport protein ExbB
MSQNQFKFHHLRAGLKRTISRLIVATGLLLHASVYGADASWNHAEFAQWLYEVWQPLIERAQALNAGNWVIISVLMLLIGLSFMTWWIALMKFWAMRRVNRLNQAFAQRVIRIKDWGEFIQCVESDQSCMASVALIGISAVAECKGFQGLSQAPWSETRDYVASTMRYAAQKIMQQQEKGSNILASVGSVAPFVGLFGTVWGIMEALKTIGATGQASIDVVAGPVGEALIATAIGIAAAVPAVIFYNIFLRKQKLMMTQYEGYIQTFLRLVLRFQVLDKAE